MWRLLAEFASYGFLKGHSVAYAELAYQTLWLRGHYLPEFLCALLNNQPMGYYPPRVLAMDSRNHGVPVLPLDVNRSQARWTVEDGGLRVSLCQLKGMTATAQEVILRARAGGGEFRSLADFILRAGVPVNIAEDLIKAGALDRLEPHRGWFLARLPRIASRRLPQGQGPLVIPEAEADVPPGLPDLGLREKVGLEWNLLGFSLAAHPVDLLDWRKLSITCLRDLPQRRDGDRARLAGCVVRYQTPPTRSGKRVVFICLEDGTGLADVAIFQYVQQRSGDVLFKTRWLMVEGVVRQQGAQGISLLAERIQPL